MVATKKLAKVADDQSAVVRKFRSAMRRVQLKVTIQLFADMNDRMRKANFVLPPGLNQGEFGAALVEELCNPHRDPEDAQQREEVHAMLSAIGIDGPEDLAGGVALGRASWRSVVTPLEVAVTRLADAATAIGFSPQHVACADELALVLRQGLHASPSIKTLTTLARPVEVLAAQVLRSKPAKGAEIALDLENHPDCVAIRNILAGGPKLLGAIETDQRCKSRRRASLYLRLMADAGMVAQTKRLGPWRLLRRTATS